MSRSRVAFVVIIVGAVLLVVIAALLNTRSVGVTGPTNATDKETAPPAGAVIVLVSSSNTKQAWMDAMAAQFNASGATLSSGKQVVIEVKHVGSGSSMDAILEGTERPAAWSPGSGTWVEQLNQAWQDRHNTRLVTSECPATVNAPLGIAMWRPMAEALGWPEQPISWNDLAALAASPDGWASLGHPEWGVFRFGHGHPAHSNSGLLSMIAEVYAAAGVQEGLTANHVWRDDVVEAVGAVETAVFHYGRKDTDLLMRMTQRGPNYLHAVTTYEGNIVLWNKEHADELRFPLVTIYPADGTFWVDNPYCILDRADWATKGQKEGAALFREFILGREQQAQLVETGLRPAMADLPLHAPISLEYGAVPTITQAEVPALPYPSDEVVKHIVDMWYQVKKPAAVVMIIDTSGSMEGEKIQAAVEATQEFVALMQPNDEVIVLAFHDEILELSPSGPVGEVREALMPKIGGLYAGGGTALYRVTIAGIERIEALRADNLAQGKQRMYSIVLMTDGQNSADDGVTEAQMLSALPDGSESSEVRLYTIAYGEDANADLLRTMANRTNGGFYVGTVDNIKDIYFQISSEF